MTTVTSSKGMMVKRSGVRFTRMAHGGGVPEERDADEEIEEGAPTTCHDQTISGGHDLVQDTGVCVAQDMPHSPA